MKMVRTLSTVSWRLFLITWLCISTQQQCFIAATSPDSTLLRWRLEALHSQRILSQDESLQLLPLCGSRSSGLDFGSLPALAQQAERFLARNPNSTYTVPGYSLRGRLQLAEQCYNVRTQLEMGARHLHLELHLVNNEIYVCKSQRSLCDALVSVTADSSICQTLFGWPSRGNSTGCHAVRYPASHMELACHCFLCISFVFASYSDPVSSTTHSD